MKKKIPAIAALAGHSKACYDLLGERKGKSRGEGLDIRQGPEGSVIPGLTSVGVASTEQVLELMARGGENRAVGSHDMNEHSSRSHSILTITCVGTPRAEGMEAVKSRLHLIDLAGSERVSKTDATGERLKEAQVRQRLSVSPSFFFVNFTFNFFFFKLCFT